MGKPQTELEPFRDELRGLRTALGNRIRHLRRQRGWSQEEFADRAHIHRTFAGSLERGEKNVSFHALALISKCFGLMISELLAGLETGEPGSAAARRSRARKLGHSADWKQLLNEITILEHSIRKLRMLTERV